MSIETSLGRQPFVRVVPPAGYSNQQSVPGPRLLTQPARRLETIQLRHSDIKHDYFWLELLRPFQYLDTVRSRMHFVPERLKHDFECFDDVQIIVGDQDAPLPRGLIDGDGRTGRTRLLTRRLVNRKSNEESATLTQSVASSFDAAAVHFDEPLSQGETY